MQTTIISQQPGRQFIGFSIIVLIASALMAQQVHAQGYTITDLGTLGGAQSRAYAINARGHVVGFAATSDDHFHAFLWDGSLHDLGTLPGTVESNAVAINDAGQIAGVSYTFGEMTPHAFLWQNGTLTRLGDFEPRAINQSGAIAGTMTISSNGEWISHACLWRNGTLTDLGTLGGSHSSAVGLNDQGAVVGVSATAGDTAMHAFIWRNGVMTDLGTLGGASSQAYAINNNGWIVGYADTGSNQSHAFLCKLTQSGAPGPVIDSGSPGTGFGYLYSINSAGQAVGLGGKPFLWQNGVVTDLNLLVPQNSDWIPASATAINDSGQIAGWGMHEGNLRAFVMTRPPAMPVTTVSAASYSGETLAAESIVAAFGTNLALTTQAAATNPLPTEIAGTKVTVRDSAGVERLAPLFFVSPTQVNYQVPQGTAPGATTITVSSGDGSLSTGSVPVAMVVPSLFTMDASGRGLAAALVLRVKADGSQSYEAVAVFNPAQNKFVSLPVDLGAASEKVYLLLFGTGIRHHQNLSTISASIGGLNVPVEYAGTQGGYVGLDQINLRLLPELRGRGDAQITLTLDGRPANPVSISIK
ncbi:MAG: hypothetical protein U0Z53_03050 [Blastocatellia bacterium]